jgi:ATP-dependent Clp protease ATP-binding subunit ClpX
MLNEEELSRVLLEPKSALIKQYKAMFARCNAKFVATDEGVKAVARKAFRMGVGARGLRSLLENLLLDASYHVCVCDGSNDVIDMLIDVQFCAGSRR